MFVLFLVILFITNFGLIFLNVLSIVSFSSQDNKMEVKAQHVVLLRGVSQSKQNGGFREMFWHRPKRFESPSKENHTAPSGGKHGLLFIYLFFLHMQNYYPSHINRLWCVKLCSCFWRCVVLTLSTIMISTDRNDGPNCENKTSF